MSKFLLSAAGIAATMALAGPAQAATLIDVFSGNDTQGCTKGFSTCFATQAGANVTNGALPSSVVVKFKGNFDLDEVSTNYGTIDGDEFEIGLTGTTLKFTYTPGAGDPNIHYFAIKQGNEYALYYHASPILGGSINLSGLFSKGKGDGFSHITFFNSRVPAVPEPSTWAMLILGFGAVGGAMRSARKRRTTLSFG